MTPRAPLKPDPVVEDLVKRAAVVSAAAPDEENLRHELEKELERACDRNAISWTSYQLERVLNQGMAAGKRFADVVHGTVVIEYEPPRSFGKTENAQFRHACSQVEEYTELLALEEGRPQNEYTMVVWDGESIAFGHWDAGASNWERVTAFDGTAAKFLLRAIRDGGLPLVSPSFLVSQFGPDKEPFGVKIVPLLFDLLCEQKSGKTTLLFTEWRRLFGQASDAQPERLKNYMESISTLHDRDYESRPAEFLFSLNTYIAIIAKIVVLHAIGKGADVLHDRRTTLKDRFQKLESGDLFRSLGVQNLLDSDFFSWYVEATASETLEAALERLVEAFHMVDFSIQKKSPESTRDLFKGIYEAFVPRDMRHALGEYYTPDWLAQHAINLASYTTKQSLLDPACGSGTFLLEALRRRLADPELGGASAQDLVDGIYGVDINPLAVLTTKASMVMMLADRIDYHRPLFLHVFLADAINTIEASTAILTHRMLTEKGVIEFRIPRSLVSGESFTVVLEVVQGLIEEDWDSKAIVELLREKGLLTYLNSGEEKALRETIDAITDLHRSQWNGIWISILAERFRASTIPQVDCVVGNPPWVKWSHLPGDYAQFIRPKCASLNVFSEDAWVGGIEADISTIVVFEALRKWARDESSFAFIITRPVFKNESSAGFRAFKIAKGKTAELVGIHDFAAVKPFDGVANSPVVFFGTVGGNTNYPIPYKSWTIKDKGALLTKNRRLIDLCTSEDFLAMPVPGTNSGPLLVGTPLEFETWKDIFVQRKQIYTARKGITTDLNGAYFVKVHSLSEDGKTAIISNQPDRGRKPLPHIRKVLIETEHLFPLLRGRHVKRFRSEPDPEEAVIVPQREMHGNPKLPASAPLTYRFLMNFKDYLAERSSYRRFQKGKPVWSTWSTGPYTFSPYKVVWKEMSGSNFVAAFVDGAKILGTLKRVVVPDHKVYFVPFDKKEHALFLVGILNAPAVAHAIGSYASQLSLGVSVVEYLALPQFDQENPKHLEVTGIAEQFVEGKQSDDDIEALESIVLAIFEENMDDAKTGLLAFTSEE